MYHDRHEPNFHSSRGLTGISSALPARFAMFERKAGDPPTTLHPAEAIAFAIAAAITVLGFIEIVFS